MNKKREKGDRIISFAVMIQSLLIVMQTVMIGVFHMDADSTTLYRVLLTAIPMIAAMIVSANRNLVRFLVTFFISIFLLLFTIAFFPDNSSFVISQGLRFFLPVVVPSFICLASVYDYNVVETTLYRISWITAALVIFYVIEFFRGAFSFDGYNMAFSYACLLPMTALYSHRKVYDMIAVFIMLLAVIAIGARGPALWFLIYVVIDLFQFKSKWRIPILILAVVAFVSLPALSSWFSGIGISSRTLNMFLGDEFLYESGRSTILAFFWNQLLEHPLTGIGMFGDRLQEGVAYCHNIVLEILLDFGFLFGSLIIVAGLIAIVSLYKKSNPNNRNRIIRYFCALVMPFMLSQSYLIDSSFAIFIGICVLLRKSYSASNVITAR